MENKSWFECVVIKLQRMEDDCMKNFLTGLLLLCGMSMVFAQAPESRAVFREIYGTVEIKAPGEAKWSPAEEGQSIARDAMVSTGFKSTAVIALGNSILSVQPLTRLSLEEIQETAGKERVDISLRTGRIRADVKPPVGGKTEFTVKSPSATASVRGTSFEFDGIHLRVDEGRVYVTGNDRSGTYVGAGHSVSADIETGRMLSAADTVRGELTPTPPAGMDSAPESLAAPPVQGGNADVESTGNIDAGFKWK
jgi:hypothetical protein